MCNVLAIGFRLLLQIGGKFRMDTGAAPLDDLTHSGNLMNDEHLRERLRVSFSCLGFGG